jgi:hypothetical protein
MEDCKPESTHMKKNCKLSEYDDSKATNKMNCVNDCQLTLCDNFQTR